MTRTGLVIALIITLAYFAAAQERNLTAVDSDWFVFRIWAPAEILAEELPAGFAPAPFVLTHAPAQAPPGRHDALLWVRSGAFILPVAGRQTRQEAVIDAFLLIPVQPPPGSSPSGEHCFWVLSVWSDNPLLNTLLADGGLKPEPLSGSFEARPLPNLAQEVIASLTLPPFSTWSITLRSSDSRAYDLGSQPWRLYWLADGKLRYMSLHLRDGLYWRAVSRADGFPANNPFDRWPEWRWADDHAIILYVPRTEHIIPTGN
jgi:hypothetical protein